MKKIITLLSLTFSLSLAKADYWTQKATLPGYVRVLGISFAINNIGYVGWGLDDSNAVRKDFWAYGLEPNRPALKAIGQYVYEQGLSPRVVSPDELFAAGVE